MFEPEDLTPLYAEEPVRIQLWMKVQFKERRGLRQEGCYIVDPKYPGTRCTRAIGHTGPHSNYMRAWEQYPGQKRLTLANV